MLAANASASSDVGMGEATLVNAGSMLVRTRLRGLETETVHEIDVGLGAMALVVLVRNRRDLLETELLLELGLSCEGSIHDYFSGCQGDGVSEGIVVRVVGCVKGGLMELLVVGGCM